MSKAEQLRAEADLAELEEAFIAAKEAGEATPDQRAELRQARKRFRELRDKVK